MDTQIIYTTLIWMHFALNLLVTLFVLKNNSLPSYKKFGKLLLLWLVPVLGLIWVWLMIRDKDYGKGSNNHPIMAGWFMSSSSDSSDGGSSDGGGGD